MIPKFRAFEYVTNTMWQSHEIDVCFRQDELYIEVPRGKNGAVYFGKSLNRITLMQSTGLYDKNGVEIFEGDIVATDLERPYLIVEKHRSYFLYNCNDGDDDYYDLMLPLCSYQDSQDYFAEVIGNIYEHTELVEVKE